MKSNDRHLSSCVTLSFHDDGRCNCLRRDQPGRGACLSPASDCITRSTARVSSPESRLASHLTTAAVSVHCNGTLSRNSLDVADGAAEPDQTSRGRNKFMTHRQSEQEQLHDRLIIKQPPDGDGDIYRAKCKLQFPNRTKCSCHLNDTFNFRVPGKLTASGLRFKTSV